MNTVEQGEAIQALMNNWAYFDETYGRRPMLSEDDKGEVLRLWRNYKQLHFWQIAKILNVDDMAVYEFLFYNNDNPEKRETEASERIKKFSSAFLPFDGAPYILLEIEKQGITVKNLSLRMPIGKGHIEETLYARRIPTTVEIQEWKKLLGLDVELWKLLSVDVAAVLDGDIPDSWQRRHIRTVEDTGNYKKPVLLRFNLAYNRLRTGESMWYSITKQLDISPETYDRWELCLESPNYKQAQKLALLLGIEDVADVYTVRLMPPNFEYYIKQLIKRNRQIKEGKARELRNLYAGTDMSQLEKIEKNVLHQADLLLTRISRKEKR